MIKSLAEYLLFRTAFKRILIGILAIAIAFVLSAFSADDAFAERKKYKKYRKNQKVHHRVYKRSGKNVRKKSRKRIRKRKTRRARAKVVRAHPMLAKARTELKIGSRYYKALVKFYAKRGYKKAWYNQIELTSNGKILLQRLRLAHQDGLDQADYNLPASKATKNGMMDDIKLSFSLIRYGEQVQAGRLSPSRIVAEHDLKPVHPDLAALLVKASTSKNPGAVLEQLPPPHPQYKLLKAKLANLRANEKSAKIHHTKLDVPMLKAVIKTTLAREDMIIANMERWRWLPRELGEKHIWINLPSYRLLVKEMGKITFSTKGIIGKIDAPTPLITSKVKNIIVNPFWNIPASVVASEILPKLQSNQSDYLQTQSIKVLRRGGRIVDPTKVDWTKITNPRSYRFRQSPGKQNALGKLKVLFPNSHSIYLHDTNEPELFANANLALSHGCIRLANPIGFADAIASYDSHLQSQMPGTLLGPRERWLKYKAILPVHLVYFTATVNADGKLVTLPDIYRYDEKTTAIFRGDNQNS